MSEKDKSLMRNVFGETISRNDALAVIASSKRAVEKFESFTIAQQEYLLEFIQGIRGLPIAYDGFYKYVFNPIGHPERLESLLSELLGQPVKIQEILTNEGVQLAEEGSLVVMDIVVKLSDGRIVDVEMQKCGYYFAGERSSCYVSDLIMRQYNRVRAREKKKFRFGKMKPVYLIVLLENSTKEFRDAAPKYIHRLHNSIDTGVEVNLLENLIYISLDTFREVGHNIDNNLEAWLTFLSSSEPEDIIRLVEKYPEFQECYDDIAIFRKKPEELMNMFSEALIQIDKNTAKYTLEEMFKEKDEELKEKETEIREAQERLEETQNTLEETQNTLEETQNTLEETQNKLESIKNILRDKDGEIQEKEALIEALLEENRKLKEQK